LRSKTKGYGGKTHSTVSHNSDTTAPSGRELYHLQFLLQVASLETFGYTLVRSHQHINTKPGKFKLTTAATTKKTAVMIKKP
jgi:hypothetical protein